MGRPGCLIATKQEYKENMVLSTGVQQCSERGDSHIPASDFGKDGSGEGNSALLVFLTVDLTGASSVWSPRERSQTAGRAGRRLCGMFAQDSLPDLLPCKEQRILAGVVAVVKYAVRTTCPAFFRSIPKLLAYVSQKCSLKKFETFTPPIVMLYMGKKNPE